MAYTPPDFDNINFILTSGYTPPDFDDINFVMGEGDWLGTWAKRRKITIDNTNIDSDLTHFPVAIVLGTSVGQSSQDLSDIFDEVGSSSLKIAITKSDGTTQIYGEIEHWDSTGEKAVIWVSKSDLVITTAAVTELYIYFDSSQSDNTAYISASGGAPGQNVWDSDFKGVYHMAQDPNGDVADAIKDSTGNGNDATPVGGMTTADLVDAQIGKGLDLDGANDQIVTANESGGDFDITDVLTLEVMARSDRTNFTNYTGLVGRQTYPGSSKDTWALMVNSTEKVQLGTFGGNTQGPVKTWSTSDYNYIASTYNSTGLTGDLFWNGAKETLSNDSLDTMASVSNSVAIGGFTLLWDGVISEVRISNSVRSDDWIKATNYSLTDDLLTFDTLETPTASTSGWNPDDKHTDFTLSNDDKDATKGTSGNYYSLRAKHSQSSGKWYFEVKLSAGASVNYSLVGIAQATHVLTSYLGVSSDGWSYFAYDGKKFNGDGGLSYGVTATLNDVIGVAVDLDNGKIFFSKNGTWMNSGDPAAGTGYAYANLSGTVFPAGTGYNAANTIQYNDRSADCTYSPPTGYSYWSVTGTAATTVEIPTAEITLEASVDTPLVSFVASIPTAEITLAANLDDPIIAITVVIPTAEITLAASLDDPLGDISITIPAAEITLVASMDDPVADISIAIPTAEITLVASMDDPLGDISIAIPTAEITLVASMDSPVGAILISIPTAEITLTARVGIKETADIPAAEITISASMDAPAVSFVANIPTAEITLVASLDAPVSFLQERADVYYICTLTGDADSLADIELPMTSFQARMRDGDPTFLSVVIPDSTQAAAINARSNGDLKVDMAYKLDGAFIQRETIITVDLETARVDEGTATAPITLSGHKTESYGGVALTLKTSIYRSTQGGKIRHRLAEPNINLRPGDTVTIGSDTFVVGLITYFISVASRTMEIAEEE